MAKGLTKRDLFGMLFEVVADSDNANKDMLCDFVIREVALLDRKASAPKRNPEAEAARAAVLEVLGDGAARRAGNIAGVTNLSVQRVTAALTALVKDGKVMRVADGKVTNFIIK